MIININNLEEWEKTRFNMYINLTEICECAGKRELDKYDNKYYTPFKITQARKIFQLIRKYGNDETIKQVNDYFDEHHYPKIKQLWEKTSA